MPRLRLLLFALLLAALGGVTDAAAQPAVVAGAVVDGDGAPLPYANVRLAGTTDGAATGADGRFAFATRQAGRQTVRASMVGFEAATARVTLAPGDTVRVQLVLRPTLVTLDEAVVTAGSFTTGSDDGATAMSPLEVVTTPGAAGDIFRAMQAFPGVARVDDGAGLFVRGGAPGETVTLLDGAVVAHPYAYESPTSGSATGGVFGTIPPFLVDGTYLSTGGFSAKYGNALSGVLAMQSQDRPQAPRQTVSVGLAAASLALDVPLADDRLGMRVSANRSFTGLLFRVNGQREGFRTVPQGVDASANLTWDLAPGHQLKLFTFGATNRVGVETTEASFAGVFRSTETRWLHHARHTLTAGRWLFETTASLNRYAAAQALGNLDLRPSDRTFALRTDATLEATEALRLRLGAEGHRRVSRFEGRFPATPGVLDPGAEATTLDARVGVTRLGGYVEAEAKLGRRLVGRAGLRADHHNLAGQAVADPRLELQVILSDATRARLAWGVYHQFPAPEAFDPDQGLGPGGVRAARAQHLVAGLQHARGDLMLRAEAYLKPYDRLVVETPEAGLASVGDGHARGLDLFARYGAYLKTRLSGWLSYSLLDARRTQARALGPASALDDGPAPFDVTHTLNAVGKVQVAGGLHLGGRLTVASGRPVTPITGGVPQDGGAYFLPVEGSVGSERLPGFRRLDVQASYYWPFREGQAVVFYLALNNALDRANVVGYGYTADYSARTPQVSPWRRSVYAGVTLML